MSLHTGEFPLNVARCMLVAARSACGTLIACAIIACGGGQSTGPQQTAHLPTCGTSTALFTQSPVAFADLLGWVPLGNLAPPGHLFPTDHQYLYLNDPGNAGTVRAVNVSAPGNVIVTRAHRTHYSPTNTYDYAIEFSPCAEVFAEFGHVTTIVQSLLDQMGAFDQNCNSYSIGTDAVFSNCYTKSLEIDVAVGAQIGTSGGQGTSFALDWTLKDGRAPPITFANPSRWSVNANGNDIRHIVPASDYYAEPMRSSIRARLGAFNGSTIRTVEPVGGTIAYDLPGTAQGIWFNAAQPTFPEASHLAVVPDNVEPARMVFSVGSSQPAFPARLYTFTPTNAGFVNRHPAQVTANAQIYCYEFSGSLGVMLARLESATSLKVEGRTGATTCAQQEPYAFGANAFVYTR